MLTDSQRHDILDFESKFRAGIKREDPEYCEYCDYCDEIYIFETPSDYITIMHAIRFIAQGPCVIENLNIPESSHFDASDRLYLGIMNTAKYSFFISKYSKIQFNTMDYHFVGIITHHIPKFPHIQSIFDMAFTFG